MNKAFVREPDDTGQRHCPVCGSLAITVPAATLDSQLSAEARQRLADTAYFCPFARCEVIYFDDYERAIRLGEFGKPVWPKDLEAPICSCFGLTRDVVESDIEDGGVTRVRALVEKAKSSEADCIHCAPSGQSCIGEVQRYYFQRRGGSA